MKTKEKIMAGEEEHQIINDKLDALLKIMNGNGKIGVCAKVNIIWGTFVFLIITIAGQAIILTRILLH
jgi:hypothetical protein